MKTDAAPFGKIATGAQLVALLTFYWTQHPTDFFTAEVWTTLGLITFNVLLVIDLATRRVQIAGITTPPDGLCMAQVFRGGHLWHPATRCLLLKLTCEFCSLENGCF